MFSNAQYMMAAIRSKYKLTRLMLRNKNSPRKNENTRLN